MTFSDPKKYGELQEELVLRLSPDQQWVCDYLDKSFSYSNIRLSEFFKGALFAISNGNKKNNPDWLAQSAHSMREIFSVFPKNEPKISCIKKIFDFLISSTSKIPKKTRKERMKDKILITQEEKQADEISKYLDKLCTIFTHISHHLASENRSRETLNSLKKDFDIEILDLNKISEVYETLIEKFIFILKRSSENIIEIYRKIDALLKRDLSNVGRREIAILFHSNIAAKQYFFEKAPLDWISWLNENEFFEILKKEAEDKTKSYRVPELRYLLRVAEEGGDQEEVVKIMNEVECDKDFNPEVVDQFLWIAQKLSPEYLVKITPKMLRENWVLLMKDFNQSTFSYQVLVKKLSEAKAYESLLELAEVLLSVNSETPEEDEVFSLSKNFYIKDIHESDIFESLASLKGENAVGAMELVSKVLNKLTKEEKPSKISPFTALDKFYVSDVDFFDLNFEEKSHLSYKEDINSLLKLYATLVQEAIGSCGQSTRDIFDKYIKTLPNSQVMWRIKLFSMSRCPKIFEEDIKIELNKIFDAPNYGLLFSGTDYLNTLKLVFSTWEKEEQDDFVRKILEKFRQLIGDFPDQDWHKDYGWEILSSIASKIELDPRVKEEASKLFAREVDPTFKPELLTSGISSGFIDEQSPINFNDEKYKDISNIIDDLKHEFTPEKIRENYKGKEEDFLHPINLEGAANALRENIKQRIPDYLPFAKDFLDPAIHIHYTYSFLRAIEEYLRDKKKLNNEDWISLFDLFNKIKKSEKIDSPQEGGRWLARWDWIEKVMADILLFFLDKEYAKVFADKRDETLDLIRYLLKSEDPRPEDEKSENLGLFHVAINSVRGRGFQVFVSFIYLDGEKLKKDAIELYKKTIEIATPSVRFVIGHYLPTFYFRDKKEIAKLFEKIFPKEKDQQYNFFAAWDGYLSNSLYKELFDELSDYYLYALSLGTSIYQGKKRNEDEENDIEKKMGIHLALAFAHFDHVQFKKGNKHPLFELMWSNKKASVQKSFVSFLGRGIISHAKAGEDWLKDEKINLEKLKDFWDFILNEENIDAQVYAEFGFWINHEKEIIGDTWLIERVVKTLGKTNGNLSWDHGLWKRMSQFAKVDAEKTLLILEKNLIDDLLAGSTKKRWFYVDKEKISIFKILYKAEPSKTKALINKLLEKGGWDFLPLKDIVED